MLSDTALLNCLRESWISLESILETHMEEDAQPRRYYLIHSEGPSTEAVQKYRWGMYHLSPTAAEGSEFSSKKTKIVGSEG